MDTASTLHVGDKVQLISTSYYLNGYKGVVARMERIPSLFERDIVVRVRLTTGVEMPCKLREVRKI